MPLIYFLSAPPGGGKTYALLLYILELLQAGENVWVIQPTKDLITQTKRDLRAMDGDIHIETIVSDSVTAVVVEIMKYLKCPYPEPHVLFTTHAAFERLPFIPNRDEWNLICDEIIDVGKPFDKILPNSHEMITPYLTAGPCGLQKYLLLTAEDTPALQRIAKNKLKDEALSVFQPLANVILKSLGDPPALPGWQ